MTTKKFTQVMGLPDVYIGKHAKQYYNVYRVLTAIGPEERLTVYGLEEAENAIKGCWDWEVTDMKGAIVL